jgi:hypothetical protein
MLGGVTWSTSPKPGTQDEFATVFAHRERLTTEQGLING